MWIVGVVLVFTRLQCEREIHFALSTGCITLSDVFLKQGRSLGEGYIMKTLSKEVGLPHEVSAVISIL